MSYACACCGFLTLPEPAGESWEICPVCGWQDDPVDNEDTDVLGPNRVKLSVARENFARFGAAERRVDSRGPRLRDPKPYEIPPGGIVKPS
jgi:Cysteine-rich CPCC